MMLLGPQISNMPFKSHVIVLFSATVVSQLLSQKVLKAKTAFPYLENCFQNAMNAASGKTVPIEWNI